MQTTTPTETAKQIVREAQEAGLWIEIGNDIITLHGSFTPNDTSAYIANQNAANSILRLAPMTYPGTVWGTDSASVGGHAGLTGGYTRMNKSGVSKRVLNAVAKLVTA